MQDMHSNDIASHLAEDILKEKRSDRRWRNFRFLCWFGLFLFIVLELFGYLGISKLDKKVLMDKKDQVALINLEGMIAPGRAFSSYEIVPILKEAFEDKSVKGVIIQINSPGGTPVQASIIHDAIVAYKMKYKKKAVVVGEDLLTSGAYFVAVAADKIYVNPNTITGSIGVIMKGFGFVDLIQKIGVERRVYYQGDQKDRLDPFLPQNPEDVAKIETVMKQVHQNFINAVLAGRKDKLKGDPAKLFNGDFWTGEKARELGLVDEVGNLRDAAMKEFGTTKLKEFGDSNNFIKMLSGQLGSAFDAMVYTY